jgi:hypothetical protein
MRRPWFTCQPADEAFLDDAPMRLQGKFHILSPAARVWDELTAEKPLSWCRLLQDVTWTSERPFGVGTTRTVTALGGANVLKERYFRWEEGRRHSFALVEASAPMFSRLAEDYLVEPEGPGSCVFTWTIAAEPRPLARIAAPVNRLLLRTLFSDTRRHYGLE